jgi:hypothetical protein
MSSATDPVAVHPHHEPPHPYPPAPHSPTPYPAAPYPPTPYPAAPYPAARYEEPQQDRVTRFIQRKWRDSPFWVAPAAMLVCMAGAVGYTLATHPTEANAGAAPTCLLKYTTGFVCPGCGGTRAAWYLLHGDVPAAARHHALFVFVVPFLLYMYVAWAGRRLFGWKVPQLTLSPGVIGLFIAAWGVFSVLRNLPWAPFTAFYV